MQIGVVGLGKVGLPLALVLREHGRHNVIGFDVDPGRVERMQKLYADSPEVHPERELRELIATGPIPVAPSMKTLVKYSNVILVMVDTPHPSGYEGNSPMPDLPTDFLYHNLRSALSEIIDEASGRKLTVLVCSTVSPGTLIGLRRSLRLPATIKLGYNPVLISLGSVVRDLTTPPMVVAGADDAETRKVIGAVWTPVVNTAPIPTLTVAEAEIAKLAMNGKMGLEIAFSNSVARLADQFGGDCDSILNVVRLADIPRVARAGMSDGGACRPRDLVVLASKGPNVPVYRNPLHWEVPLWKGLIAEREYHMHWLAARVAAEAAQANLPIFLCGEAYKPEVPYTFGSPAALLHYYLTVVRREGQALLTWDPVTCPDIPYPTAPALYVLATAHGQVLSFFREHLPTGSFAFDPWGYLPAGGRTIRPGRQPRGGAS